MKFPASRAKKADLILVMFYIPERLRPSHFGDVSDYSLDPGISRMCRNQTANVMLKESEGL